MKKQHWVLLFMAVLAADLLLIYFGKDTLRYLSKSLLLIVLGSYFFTAVRASGSKLTKWIILALVFSWLGDVLLMFEQQDTRFFMAGLVAFLVAHFFYITFFSTIQREESSKRQVMLGVIAVVWYFILMKLIQPAKLGDLSVPVRIYGAVIMIMLWMALQMLYINNKWAGWFMVAGAILFVVSDSTLAINKFYQSFNHAGVAVMLTYGLAQLCLVEGAVRYILVPKEK
ncbi:MAG: lysoplasmalogenase [Terrimonas sp.]|nr:lysoplasmalogenase [Terrimonas sp.]